MNRRRRRAGWIAIVLGLAAMVAVELIGFTSGNDERVRQIWTTATVGTDGSATVSETIDYVFPSSRHGIYRDVPGLSPAAEVSVVADAPADTVLIPMGSSTRIRIGDPNRKVTGRHRYVLGYPLPTVMSGSQLAWNGVGTAWTVPIERAHVEVVAPWRWTDARCDRGTTGAFGSCEVTQPEPGRLVVSVKGLSAGEGVTLWADRGAMLPAVPTPGAVQGFHDPRSSSPALMVGLSVVAAILAAAGVARLLRRLGRDWVGDRAGAAGAAFGGATPMSAAHLVDDAELEGLTTIEFAPPPDVAPWQGAQVLVERVRPEHKVAWLIGTAIDGEVDIEGSGGKGTTLERLAGHGASPTSTLLDIGFAGRKTVQLGTYDPSFTAMWKQLDATFRSWGANSDLWDPDGDRNRRRAVVIGLLVALGGLGVAFLGAHLSASSSAAFMAVGVVGGAVAVGGVAALARSWELRRRTPLGSSLYLRVESFRRFLAESEAQHAQEAAQRGVLRQYTAWAVAVGEVDHWSRACAAAGTLPEQSGLQYAAMAPLLMTSTVSTATRPSSSGGGSGFGGGAGGGFGGGGGGSW